MKNKKKVLKKDPRSYKKLICSMEWDEKSIQKDASGDLFISGYANTVDKDRVGDVVLPEAFAKTLETYMDNPMLLYMHDWDRVAGKVVKAEIDEKGLKIKARLSSSKDCEDIRTKVKEKDLRTFSIGYNEIDADWDKETATNYVKELELLEISIVSIPCNTQAKFEPVEEEKGEEEPKSAPNNQDNQETISTLVKEFTMKKKELDALIAELKGKKNETSPKAEDEKGAEEGSTEEKGSEEGEEEKNDEPADEEKGEEEDNDEEKNADMGDEEVDQLKLLSEKVDLLSDGMAAMLEMISLLSADQKGDNMDDEEEDDEEEKALDEMTDEEGAALLAELEDSLEEVE